AVRGVRGCKTRLDVLAGHHGKRISLAAAFECVHGIDRNGTDQQAKNQGCDHRDLSATRKYQHHNCKSCEPKSDCCCDAVLIDTRKLQVTLRPALPQLESARLLTRDLQIGRGFRMMLLQGERAFVIQNRAAKIVRPEISIAEIVKQSGAQLSCTNECLVAGDRFLEMALCVLLVCLCEICIGLRKRRPSPERAEKKRNATG